MNKLILTVFSSALLLACGNNTDQSKNKVKAIYQPWTVVDTKALGLQLVQGKTKEACAAIRQKVEYCQAIVDKINEKQSNMSQFKAVISFVSDDEINNEDKTGYSTKETKYNWEKRISDILAYKGEVTFKTKYDGDKGYLVEISDQHFIKIIQNT